MFQRFLFQILFFGFEFFIGAAAAQAQTTSWITWTADSTIDGKSAGSIANNNAATPASISVDMTSTPVLHNGGMTLTGETWSTYPGSNNVPGISASMTTAGIVLVGSQAAPATNTVNFKVGGLPYAMPNPILVFNYVNAQAATITFPTVPNIAGSLTLIDHNFASAPTISGNVINFTGAGDSRTSGFAVQLKGNYSSIVFVGAASLPAGSTDSFGFSILIPNYAVLEATRSATTMDLTSLGNFAIPGNGMSNAITVTNIGGAAADSSGIFVAESIPASAAFFTGDADGAGPGTGPVQLTLLNGANVTLTQSGTTGVKYSNSPTQPASFSACTYTPVGTYDADVRFICVQPAGALASGNPYPGFRLQYLLRIN